MDPINYLQNNSGQQKNQNQQITLHQQQQQLPSQSVSNSTAHSRSHYSNSEFLELRCEIQ